MKLMSVTFVRCIVVGCDTIKVFESDFRYKQASN